jgi:muramoyltetrapeptide carboxypeptidase LdcA involved in peptidoglycan recycling
LEAAIVTFRKLFVMSKKTLSLIRPPKLEQGDKVGVVAPAGPVDKKQLQNGLEVISEMGFQPVVGRYVHCRSRFLAGSDMQRAQDIMDMVRNPEIKAVFCARGGYGTNRVLQYLDAKVIRANAKVFVGSSDITLLLHYLYLHCGVLGFHGPIAQTFQKYFNGEGICKITALPKCESVCKRHGRGENHRRLPDASLPFPEHAL